MEASVLSCRVPLVKENIFLAFNKMELSFSPESSNFANSELLHEKARPMRVLLTTSP